MAGESYVAESYTSLNDGLRTESGRCVAKSSSPVGRRFDNERLGVRQGTVATHVDDEAGQRPSKLWTEVKVQCRLAWPMMVTNLLSFSLVIVPVMFVGHLGELELSSASLSNSFGSVTGYTVMVGLASALDTLCGQAYGAKRYHLMGVYLQAAMLVNLFACLPILFLWLNLEKILLRAGQDPEISRMAASYLRYNIPGLFSCSILQPVVRYLQAQSLVLPMMICSVITALLHPVICYLIIYPMGFGYHGGAVATTTSFWFLAVLLLGYTFCSGKCSKTWDGFTLEAFGATRLYFRLAIPSAGMICLEYWSDEILVFLSGLLPNPQLEVSLLSICLNTAALTFMIPYGLSVAASTRVSNELGANNPGAAKLAVNVVLGLAIIQSCLLFTLMICLRNLWGHTFTDEEDVVNYVAGVIPLLALSTFMDGIQGVLSGVARGCGRQDLGAFVNLGAFYGIGMPAAVLLGFTFKLSSKGLWMGLTCGIFVQMTCLLIIVLHTNWEKMAQEAQSRIQPTEPLLPSYVEPSQTSS